MAEITTKIKARLSSLFGRGTEVDAERAPVPVKALIGSGASTREGRAERKAAAKPGGSTGGSVTNEAGFTQQKPLKAKPGQTSLPSYVRTAKPTGNWLPQTDRRLYQTDITTFRGGVATWQVIRDLAAASPDLSAAVFAMIHTAITDEWTAVVRNRADGTVNTEAMGLLAQILARFNYVPDYSAGFSNTNSIMAISEQLAKEVVLYGACSAELVLDKTRLPANIVPLNVPELKFIQEPDNVSLQPQQYIVGQRIDLNIPTFFYESLDQDLTQPYPSSPIESAVQSVLASSEFQNDLWRVIKRAIHPRLHASIDQEKFKLSVPPDILHDQDKFKQYVSDTVSQIEDMVNGLNPEDAIVGFDTVEIDYLTGGNTNLDAEWKVLNDIFDAKMATGAKTLPSILGHGQGSQNIASSETMMFMKNAMAVQNKVNAILSRILTLAVRLFGQDVYVEFKFASIDLRPKLELESFRSMKQSRVLELLSLGMLTDEEASIELTGALPPSGMKPLSGTGFRSQTMAQGGMDAPGGGNPYNGSAANGGVQEQTNNSSGKSKAPQAPKGSPKNDPKNK
jgi:hypothetical protein